MISPRSDPVGSLASRESKSCYLLLSRYLSSARVLAHRLHSYHTLNIS